MIDIRLWSMRVAGCGLPPAIFLSQIRKRSLRCEIGCTYDHQERVYTPRDGSIGDQ
jgi:hypothetical protein